MKKRILSILLLALVISSLSFAAFPFTTFRWNQTHEVYVNLKNIIPPYGTFDFLADERPPPQIVQNDPLRQNQQNVRYYLPSGRSCVSLRDPIVSNAGPISVAYSSDKRYSMSSYSLLGYRAGICNLGLPTTNTSTVTITPYLPSWGRNSEQMTIQIEHYDDSYYVVGSNQKKYRTKAVLLASCSRSLTPTFRIASINVVGDLITYNFLYSYQGFCGWYKENWEANIPVAQILLALGFVGLLACSSICIGICVVSAMIYISCCSLHLIFGASKKKLKKMIKETAPISDRASEFELGQNGGSNSPSSTPAGILTPSVNQSGFLIQAPPMAAAPAMQQQQRQLPQLPQLNYTQQQQRDIILAPMQVPQYNPQSLQQHQFDDVEVYDPMSREEEAVGQMQYPTFEYPN